MEVCVENGAVRLVGGWVRSSGIYVLSIFFPVLVSVLVDPAFFFLFFWFLNLYDTSLWLLSTFAYTRSSTFAFICWCCDE
jgi:hypothetical protein